MKLSLLMMVALGAGFARGGLVEVQTARMVQEPSRRVAITYTLSAVPAVVTLDLETNTVDGAWVSIGGSNFASAMGDVWKRVTATEGTIYWNPVDDWPGEAIGAGGIRARVTAWPLDDTPDYMVVGLTESAAQEGVRYYPSVDCLPGGLLGNAAYRTTHLVMRKIMAKGVEWTMGSVAEKDRAWNDEWTHQVTLTNNYYLGVFEVTQAQWANVLPSGTADGARWPSYFNNTACRDMRPVEKVSYNQIRCTSDIAQHWQSDAVWPKAPSSGSFLGYLKARTGLDFDLPGEAQWEFACRAGNGEGRWGDGSRYLGGNDANAPGRLSYNGGKLNNAAPPQDTDTSAGTATVGTNGSNLWGLFDMHGNVFEWCNDGFVSDIKALGGQITTTSMDKPVRRGGCWWLASANARSACRGSELRYKSDQFNGFRLYCQAGLK